MKEIVINDDYLKHDDMEEEVVRVKALIINSRGKIILAHNNNTYQFPGGHTEENESIEDCIIREVKEETGISLEIKDKPFLCITTYDNNYFNTGRRVLNRIYYFRFLTDQIPNLSETHYDSLELETDFNLFYLNFSDLETFLQKHMSIGEVDPKIAREMMFVIDEYQKVFGESNE